MDLYYKKERILGEKDLERIVNPNLLDNSDFANPVNRNGKTEYNIGSREYGIDRWFGVNVVFRVESDHCHVSITRKSEYKRITQLTESTLKAGAKYTLSVLINVTEKSGNVFFRACTSNLGTANGAINEPLKITSGYQIITTTVSPTVDVSNFGVEIFVHNTTSDYFEADIKAWKLELGDQQTLAHQDEDGNWVLNEIPNYAEQYSICSQYSPSTGEFVGSQQCNRNLLKNFYFVNPVNRNGKTKYSGSSVFAIDKWAVRNPLTSLEITNKGLKFSIDSSTTNSYFTQTLDSMDILGKTVTISALITDVNLSYNGILVGLYGGDKITNATLELCQTSYTNKNGLISATAKLPNSINYSMLNFGFRIVNNALPGDSATIIAAKLELGPVQTLAHKEGDQWVLNEIPNYAEQYTICEQYSPSTGEFIGSQHSNPSILDNGYFIGGGSQQGNGQFPINQGGETEYTQAGYGIDRWVSEFSMFLTTDGIKLPKGDKWLLQRIDPGISDCIRGKTVTGSFLLSDGSLLSGSAIVPNKDQVTYNTIVQSGTIQVQIGHTQYENYLTFRLIDLYGNREESIEITLVAVKLELGPVQTLAHKEGDKWVLNDPPPNYQQELAKCQRYQLVLSSDNFHGTYNVFGIGKAINSTDVEMMIPISVTLRAVPSVTYEGSIKLVRSTNFVNGLDISSINNTYSSCGANTIYLRLTASDLSAGETYLLASAKKNTKLILDANI